jgi:hypothetical protein
MTEGSPFDFTLIQGHRHMSTETDGSYHNAMTSICLDVINTVADQPGDSPSQRSLRRQTVADTVMSLMPHDPVETMLAGQCVIFEHLVREGARDLLRGQAELIKLRARPQICASAKMLLSNLDKFEQRQARSIGQAVAEQAGAGQAGAGQAGAEQAAAHQPGARTSKAPAVPSPRPMEAGLTATASANAPLADLSLADLPLANLPLADAPMAEAEHAGPEIEYQHEAWASRLAEVNRPTPRAQQGRSSAVSDKMRTNADATDSRSDPPRPIAPLATGRRLARLLARPGKTGASVDDVLVAAYHDVTSAREAERALPFEEAKPDPGGVAHAESGVTNGAAEPAGQPTSVEELV